MAIRCLALLCIFFFFPCNAYGQDSFGNIGIPAYARSVYIEISDQAVDGCWTNASAVHSRMRYIFETAGIPVLESDENTFLTIFSPLVLVTVLGERTASGVCYGLVRFSVNANISSNIVGS